MTALAPRYDAVIVGAGMAGASLAAEIAPYMSVLLVEMEERPGYHATGRSVAFWSESYGGAQVAPLTRASLGLFENPDPAFSTTPFIFARGALHIGRAGDEHLRDALAADFRGDAIFQAAGAEQVRADIPGIKADWTVALAERSTCDIDVAALHAAYLRAFRARGGTLCCDMPLREARRQEGGGGWHVELAACGVAAGLVINAAGAWADTVARACGVSPIGITPLKRTVAQLRVDPPVPDDLPLVLGLHGDFYFKPGGGGRLWVSPHDEQPHEPGDVAADELDVAVAVDRLQQVVDWRIEAVERKWAGLRSFAPDRLPVYGHDPAFPGFFWFAGQGGFGIQTAPAAAMLGRWLIVGGQRDAALAGIDASLYGPDRFR